MTTIYLVTNGDYSDYRVMGAYSTMAHAERALSLYDSDNPIEEFDLDDMPEAPPGLVYWCVQMDRDGNTLFAARRAAPSDTPIVDWMPGSQGRDPWDKSPRIAGPCIAFYVWAKDEEHAVKIANERRTRLLADGEWTTDYTEWRKRFYPEVTP